ncbi:MAG: DNA topoisomerase, partial [Desulfovibrionaceae bacterium]|nr:DNA topoisomerase [Desulfovibrionaceae bacterium]
IRALLKICPTAVNAADFDREGQLLVDEVLELFNYRGTVLRLQTRALDATSLRRELGRMKPNSEFAGLRDAARARSRLDWLAGINLTRAMTLHGRSRGAQGLLSLGRVQTPTLALVVQRDEIIENFEPKPFYKLECPFTAEQGIVRTQLVLSAGMPGTDEEKRLVDRAAALAIRDRVSGKEGTVQAAEKKLVRERPPLPYNLTELQKEASARYGMGAQATLAAAQALYEGKHISYPRTDCQYLPMEQFKEAPDVLAAVGRFAGMSEMVEACSTDRKSAAWNTAKVSAHHAIIPTSVPAAGLSDREAKIYAMICRRYAWQFLPEHVFNRTKIDVLCEGYLWRANGRIEVSPGWTAFRDQKGAKSRAAAKGGDSADGADGEGNEKDVILPEVRVGERVQAGEVQVNEAMTTPPARFTEGTLVDAMENIQRYVRGASADDQTILKKTEGLGTVATRASIIETLFDRHYLEKHGKALQSTPLGRDLVHNSPQVIKDPLMTADMERSLSEIQAGRLDPDAYVAGYAATLPGVIGEIFACEGDYARGPETLCPECGRPMRRAHGKTGWYWVCTGAPECGGKAEDRNGVPVVKGRRTRSAAKAADGGTQAGAADGEGRVCPRCGKELVLRKGPRGEFWGCRGFPSCRFTAPGDSEAAAKGSSASGGMPASSGSAPAAGVSSDMSSDMMPGRSSGTVPSSGLSSGKDFSAVKRPARAAASAVSGMPRTEAGITDDGAGPERHRGAFSAPGGNSHADDEVPAWMLDEPPCLDEDLPPADMDMLSAGEADMDHGLSPDMDIPFDEEPYPSVPDDGEPGPVFSMEEDARAMPSDDADGSAGDSVAESAKPAKAGKAAKPAKASASARAAKAVADDCLCPRCGHAMKRRKGVRGYFWGCTAYPSCRFTVDDKDGVPDLEAYTRAAGLAGAGADANQAGSAVAAASAGSQISVTAGEEEAVPSCPRCGRPMKLRKGPRGEFWGCSNFPRCRGTLQYEEGLALAQGGGAGADAAAGGETSSGKAAGPASQADIAAILAAWGPDLPAYPVDESVPPWAVDRQPDPKGPGRPNGPNGPHGPDNPGGSDSPSGPQGPRGADGSL